MEVKVEEIIMLDPDQEKKALRIHEQAIIIDGLCYMYAPTEDSYLKTMIDAGITATNMTIPDILDNFEQAVKRIADWYQSLTSFRDLTIQVFSVEDIHTAKDEGKTAIIMGFQDTKPIENTLKLIDIFHQLGVRIIQLTYQSQNLVGCGCGEEDKGLTPFGRDLVKKLNDNGILVDLSHCGPNTTLDAIKVTTQPIVFTHAGVHARNNHVRNKTNEHIIAIAEKGGLIGLPSYSQFLYINESRLPTIIDYLETIDYVVNLVGIDHVALGLDFTPTWKEDDYNKAAQTYPEIYLDYSYKNSRPKGLSRITDVINITRGLVAKGYSEKAIYKVLGENFIRVFTKVWN